MRLAVYISGHGYGHLAQLAPVLERLAELRPESRFLIRCALPESEIRARLSIDFTLEQSPVDVGVVQKSAIEEDPHASLVQLRNWVAGMDEQLLHEHVLMQQFQPSVILSDISPLAFPLARALSVPGIALASLDWHSIYSHWLHADDPCLLALAAAYSSCDLLLKPPMSMDMKVFKHYKDISLVVSGARKRIDPMPAEKRRKALVLFGGCGQPVFDMQALAVMDEWLFLIPGAGPDRPDNVQDISIDSEMRAADWMAFVDVVVCKPGYGVLAECWSAGKPIAWVERPYFPEFPMLKRWLDDAMPAAGMSRCSFRKGHWQQAMTAAIGHSRAFPVRLADGADEAAEHMLAYARMEGL